jgi:hypothetical protein
VHRSAISASTLQVEEGESRVAGQLGFHSKTLFQKPKKKKN